MNYTIENMMSELSELEEHLSKLKDGNIKSIEYGDPNNPGGYLSGIRITYIPTAGGLQFRISQLFNGIEGGSIYHPTIDGAARISLTRKNNYIKPNPNPFIRRLLSQRKQTELSWFISK